MVKRAVKKTSKRRTVAATKRRSSARQLPDGVRPGNPAALERWMKLAFARAIRATPRERAQADAEIELVIRSMNEDRVRDGMRKLTDD